MKNERFDAIVVGSGPGGATVAKELVEKGENVLMLEWGNNEPINGTPYQTIRNMGIPGKHLLFTHNMLGMVRGITTGGSSIYYYGTCFPPPVSMLRDYGVDIAKEVEEAKQELPNAPLSDELLGPMAKRIMESARNMGYEWEKLPKFIYQDKCKKDCHRCNYGCPYEAKWNSRMFVEDSRKKGLHLVTGAKCKKVILENNKAVGVEYMSGLIPKKAYAEKVIISAGGIGSPVILRATGIKEAGYDYFFDPLIAVFGVVDEFLGGREIPMATGVHMDNEGYMMTDMTVPWTLYHLFASEVFRFDRFFQHGKTLTIMVKEKDSLGGRLTDIGGVRKKLADSDKKAILKGYERATGILENAGAKKIFKSWYVAAHPGGTVKIGHLVDSDLKTQYDNLYVCDCSVIPESFGLPPTLTLVALGKRLAAHLEGAQTGKSGKTADAVSENRKVA